MKLQTAQELISANNRTSRVIVKEDGVTIDRDYFIPASRIDTVEKLLGWAHHLLEKDWFTPADARDLIEKVARLQRWTLYGTDIPKTH